jgi:outer membrane murein-binding lipoprotein Lpp
MTMKLPKRLTYEILIVASLMIGSCSQGLSDAQKDEITEIAGDSFDSSELEAKIASLESDQSDLEDRLTQAEAELTQAQSELSELDDTDRRIRNLEMQLNM